ncbi:MAG: CoA transferase, partial [Chloroflexota bacterium]
VHVESATRPDALRMQPPFKEGRSGINRSGFFGGFNTGKLSLAANLSTAEGRSVGHRLALWADVVVENFAPGQMERWGLGYSELAGEKPDLIMFSSTLQGQSGPWRGYVGLGIQGSALAGLHYLIGWPDRGPFGPAGAYTDIIAPRFSLALLMAALDYRSRTGAGQHIDLAQTETAVYFLSPEILDCGANGRIAQRAGNQCGDSAPHGVFPCAGSDRWIAISVETNDQWRALVEVLGTPPWGNEPGYRTTDGRVRHRAALQERLAEFTRQLDPYDLMNRLQAAGVPAGVVQTPGDLQTDPQLSHRGHFQVSDHAEMGPTRFEGVSFKLSGTPGGTTLPPPCLGEHTHQVLMELLAYGPEEIEGLERAGALM